MPRAVLLDNFDSFTWNVAHVLAEAGAEVRVRRADEVDLPGLRALRPDLLVISPGPGHPAEATLALEAVRHLAGEIPMFGVCLGMQVMALAFGGDVGPAGEPVHGKITAIAHDGRGVFLGLPSPLPVGRYHSLCVTCVPEALEVQTRTPEGLVMALRHPRLPLAGVQFHPDSFLTAQGREMMAHALRGNL